MHRSIAVPLCALFICFSLAAAASAQAKRLDYKSVEALQDAKYYIAQVEGNMKMFEERYAGWKVGDPAVPLGEVESMLSTRAQVDKYMENIETRFKSLPANHPEVQKERQHTDAIKVQVEKTFTHLNNIKSGLAGVVKQGESEEYKVDAKRLDDINEMFRDTSIFAKPPAAAAIVAQVPNVKAERQRIAEKYKDLLNQTTPPAMEMKRTLEIADERLKAFEAEGKQVAAALPGVIDGHLKRAIDGANQAVAERKPAWFSPTSDIAGSIRQADEAATLLAAFDANAAAPFVAKVAESRKQVATAAESLQAEVLEAARVPEERFAGTDKADLTERVKAKWASEGNGAEVLKAGMNSSGWTRETRWEWNGGAWRFVDYSRTQGFVLAKLDDQTAAVYHINLSKDHLNSDRIGVSFFDEPKEKPSLSQKVLLKNVQ